MDKTILKEIVDWKNDKTKDLRKLYQQIFSNMGFSTSDFLFSNELLEKNLTNDNLLKLKTEFNKLNKNLILYIISISLNYKYLCYHHILIYLLTDEQSQLFQPGILSFYFKILDESNDMDVIKNSLLCLKLFFMKKIVIETKGKEIFYSLLTKKLFNYQKITKEVCDLLNVCKDIFEDVQKVFVLKFLVLNEIQLSTEEYLFLKNNLIAELEKNNNEIKINFFKVTTPSTDWDFKDDTDFVKNVAVSESSYCENFILIYKINKLCNNCLKKDLVFNKLVKNNNLNLIDLYVKNKNLRKFLREKCEIKQLAKDNEHLVINYIYKKINFLKTKHKNLLEYAVLVENKTISKKQDTTNKNIILTFNKNLNIILKYCIEFKKSELELNLEFIIDIIIKFLDVLKIDTILNMFELLKSLINKATVEKIIEYFNEIIYLDLDSVELRSKKYEIIDTIFIMLFTQHKDKDNYLPLVAKIWEEISIVPEKTEIQSVLKLLTTIIKFTKTFYERRLTKFSLINYLFENKNVCLSDFLEFLYQITAFFEFEDLVLVEKIWMIVFEVYTNCDVKLIIHNLIRKKRYFSFYVINLNKLDCKLHNFLKIYF